MSLPSKTTPRLLQTNAHSMLAINAHLCMYASTIPVRNTDRRQPSDAATLGKNKKMDDAQPERCNKLGKKNRWVFFFKGVKWKLHSFAEKIKNGTRHSCFSPRIYPPSRAAAAPGSISHPCGKLYSCLSSADFYVSRNLLGIL